MGLLILRFINDLKKTRRGRIALRVLIVVTLVLAVLVGVSFARI